MGQPFGSYQNEIYFDGLRGVRPRFPMSHGELEARALAVLPESVRDYVAGGAGDERTQRANVAAFERWGLYPRMFVGAARRDLSVDVFGMALPAPLFMAPIGVIGLCAQDRHGDLATVRAAARTGVPMVASTFSVDPMEAVAAETGPAPALFQLYTPTDRDLAGSLVERAEKVGATAVGIGRPYAYGLAVGGTDGIVHVLRSVLAEADLLMAVDGYPTLADLTPEALRRVG